MKTMFSVIFGGGAYSHATSLLPTEGITTQIATERNSTPLEIFAPFCPAN
jgi:hypothetical protein